MPPRKHPGRPKTKKPIRKPRRKPTVRKPAKKAKPKNQKPKRSTKPDLVQEETKRQKQREYDQQRNNTPGRKEYQRAVQSKLVARRKELGLCVNCGDVAIPGQTRCESCAEEHRITRRKNDANRRAAAKQAVAPGQQAMPTQTRGRNPEYN